MSKTIRKVWAYGDPPPRNYRELAGTIRELSAKAKKKPNRLMERLDQMDKLIREKK